jgi:drug/metabolite transporter (DMT)-like permease
VTPTAPEPARRAPDVPAVLTMLGLCLVWGTQQVLMKSIATDIAPTLQLAIRFAGSALFFGAWVLAREGRRAFTDGTLTSGVLLGSTFALEFVLVGEALRHTSAAHTIVFMYSAPIFTALGLQFLPEEHLRRLQWAGIAIAFGGIVIAFLGHAEQSLGEVIRGDLLALGAGAGWGLSNVVLRRGRIGDAPAIKTVFYQVSTAALVLGAFSLATGQTRFVPSPLALAVMLFQTVVIAIASYLVWFRLLRRYLTSRLMLFSLLTPLVGVAFGALVLGEHIELRFAVGAALVLGGILVVNARQLLERAR